jgi:hypothetical protein
VHAVDKYANPVVLESRTRKGILPITFGFSCWVRRCARTPSQTQS